MKYQQILVYIVLISLGTGLGWIIGSFEEPNITLPIRENSSEYHFINPLLLSESVRASSSKHNSLEKKIKAHIDTAIRDKNAKNISYYFRDLNSGTWFGLNEDLQYSPASMLKVAILIAYLRSAESNPALLNQKIFITPQSINLNENQIYVPNQSIEIGKTYTTDELIFKMIINSDNNAAAILTSTVGTSSLAKIYTDLQLPTSDDGTVDYMSPRLYSRLFRTLYNSTYLSHEISEKTLDLLSRTTFIQGLQAGVPQNTFVSHKFGERTITDTQGTTIERELHDCGIVYYPENPYFICIMTKGTEFPKLESVIQSLSRITWKEVDATEQ